MVASDMSAKMQRLIEVNSIGMSDWANLQTDLVGIIIKKLAVPDFLRFRAVCTSWNHVCRDVSNRPRIDPWLMLPPKSLDGANFFCIPERKNQIIRLPSTATMFGSVWSPVGSSHGWVIFFGRAQGTMHMLNPITGAQIQLPPIGHRPFSKAILLDMNERNFTVAVIFRNQKGYKVTRKGSNNWSSVESKQYLVDIFKHGRQIYTIDTDGTVDVWAEPPRAWPDEDALLMNHPHNPIYNRPLFNCLVETPAGDLMKVKRQSRNKFVVSVLNKGTFSWEKIDNIGELALFVSNYSSISFQAKDHPNLKSNCVYFIDMYNNLCAFNLENGTKELVETLETGGQPESHSLRHQREEQHYMWFIPSLAG